MKRRCKVRSRIKKAILYQPCAVMQYFEWFKTDRDYEDIKLEIIILDLELNHLIFIELRESEELFFRENMGGFTKVEDNVDGKVWEQGEFRKIVKALKPTK